jgi:hypothetical protein
MFIIMRGMHVNKTICMCNVDCSGFSFALFKVFAENSSFLGCDTVLLGILVS